MLIFTAFIVAVFYCLDALHGERRDRSILFWKSLPVSDLTTVLSKTSIPLVVLPVIALAIFFFRAVHHAADQQRNPAFKRSESGNDVGTTSSFQNSLAFSYGLVAIALWHAPIYGWLLVLLRARRATFLGRCCLSS